MRSDFHDGFGNASEDMLMAFQVQDNHQECCLNLQYPDYPHLPYFQRRNLLAASDLDHLQ